MGGLGQSHGRCRAGRLGDRYRPGGRGRLGVSVIVGAGWGVGGAWVTVTVGAELPGLGDRYRRGGRGRLRTVTAGAGVAAFGNRYRRGGRGRVGDRYRRGGRGHSWWGRWRGYRYSRRGRRDLHGGGGFGAVVVTTAGVVDSGPVAAAGAGSRRGRQRQRLQRLEARRR